MPRDLKKPTSAQTSQNLVGSRVRRLRNLNLWSQTTLATACQLNGWDAGRDIIAKIESQTRQVTDHELVVLAWVLGVTVSELIGETSLPGTDSKVAALLADRLRSRVETKVNGMIPQA